MEHFSSTVEQWNPMGEMLLEHQRGTGDAYCVVRSSIEPDRLTWASHYFRKHGFSPLEKKALKTCKGRVLDVGAGAGSHSLALQKKGFDTTALEISARACECMQQRGVANVVPQDFFDYTPEAPFDTLLLMMNGIGFIAFPERFPDFFEKADSLLQPGGQIICDSTDISYVNDWSRQAASLPPVEGCDYYGCVHYQLVYGGKEGQAYAWLFADMDMLAKAAAEAGYDFRLLHKEDRHHYLCQLKRRPAKKQ